MVGCTPHPIGPARTADDYERKARTTAEGALSAVETARLLAEGVAGGDTALGYAGTVASEQEDALDGLGSTFGSIQPPGEGSDRLRAQLAGLLDEALDAITDLRVAVRRGAAADDPGLASSLEAAAEGLRSFLEAHR